MLDNTLYHRQLQTSGEISHQFHAQSCKTVVKVKVILPFGDKVLLRLASSIDCVLAIVKTPSLDPHEIGSWRSQVLEIERFVIDYEIVA